jgi:hypothetical protein
MRGPTFIKTKSSIRIMMTIIMKLVPLIPALRLSTRVPFYSAILSFRWADCQAL